MVAGAFEFPGRFLAARRWGWLARMDAPLLGVAVGTSRTALVALAVAGLRVVLASGLVGGKPGALSPPTSTTKAPGRPRSSRAPCPILLTVFGRMGAVGTALLATVRAAVALRAWRAGHRSVRGDDGTAFRLLLGGRAIFSSAGFSVVPAGPWAPRSSGPCPGSPPAPTDEKTEADLRPAGPGPDMSLRTAP